MYRDFKHFLVDMADSAANIDEFTKGYTYEQFIADKKTASAVIRQFEILGEAAKNIPVDFKDRHPEIDWKRIAGLRDVLIHGYFGIDLEIIWDIIQGKVPTLRAQLKIIIEKI